MNKSTVIIKICSVLWAIVWRMALIAAVLAILAAVGLGMVLNTVLTGPSEAARDALTVTLLEYESTRAIPGYFLDQSTIDAICAADDTLPAAVSDPSLIEVDAFNSAAKTDTVTTDNYTARITLSSQPDPDFDFSAGRYYAGLTDEGILTTATSAEEASALGITGRCEKILLMNGQINTGLFCANSGFAPRCAIGQRADGTLILVTTNGGDEEHPGATWKDMINIMTEYGAVNACGFTGDASASEE